MPQLTIYKSQFTNKDQVSMIKKSNAPRFQTLEIENCYLQIATTKGVA